MQNSETNKAHPHAENMRLYAEDAAETSTPWERWETAVGNRVVELSGHPNWVTSTIYRRKPKVYTPTLQDYALEFEIETNRLVYSDHICKQTALSIEYAEKLAKSVEKRSPAMVEYLVSKQKHGMSLGELTIPRVHKY